MRTLIRNARVLTLDAEDRDLARANILIDGAEIIAVGPDAEFAPPSLPAEEIDATGLLAIPGLVNGHFHSPANLMKGTLPGLPLEVFMLYEVPPLSDRPPPPRLVYVRTLLGAIEMLKLGVTSVQDDAFFVPFPDGPSIDALMSAYADVGIRATVALDQPNVVEYEKHPFLRDLLPERVQHEMEAVPIPSAAELLGLYEHLIDTWHGAGDGRIRAAVSCSAPHRVTEAYLGALSELSHAHDLPFYIHILETKLQRVFGDIRYGKSLVQHVRDLGLLGQRVNVIHGIWIDEHDMAAIADAGAVIAHTPVCNLRLGSGIMPFRHIREFGIPVCLGTDEALADDSINLWTVAKMAGLVHNITDPDYRNWPTAEEVLACVFHGGARAMGLEDRLGRIAPGYAADISLLDLDDIAFTPLNNLRRQLVYCENGASVRLTMVAGCIVVRDGRVLSVDEDVIKCEARELTEAYRPELRRAVQAARKLEPFYREMYLRAAAVDVGMNRWRHAGAAARD
jgi:5-methylthioadenosine/S-adenosylhomocysteine deaminase